METLWRMLSISKAKTMKALRLARFRTSPQYKKDSFDRKHQSSFKLEETAANINTST